jgi:hypothetical protein
MAINEFFVTSRVDRWYVDNGVDSHGPYLRARLKSYHDGNLFWFG